MSAARVPAIRHGFWGLHPGAVGRCATTQGHGPADDARPAENPHAGKTPASLPPEVAGGPSEDGLWRGRVFPPGSPFARSLFCGGSFHAAAAAGGSPKAFSWPLPTNSKGCLAQLAGLQKPARKPICTELSIIPRDTMTHPDALCHHLPRNRLVNVLDSIRDRCYPKTLKKRFLITFLPDTAARAIICESNLTLCKLSQRNMTNQQRKQKDYWLRNTIITFEKISKWSESKNGLLYIICISLTLKAFLFMSDSVVNKDGLLYIAAAQKFAEGHFSEGISIYPMPFYPLLIAIVHFLIPDWVTAGRIISVVFVVFTLIPLYFTTKELFDRKAAFWACLAFAIAPVPNGWAESVIRDPGFIFCMAWAVFFALRAIQSQRIVFFVAAALFSWVSILFRLEGIIFILFFPLYLVALCFKRENNKVRLLKGVFLWILFPLVFSAVLIAALGCDGIISLNRSGDIITQAQKFLRLGFLDNYFYISEQLINLEKYSLYPGGRQHLVETARHYIPIIYLFGLLETLVVVLFPLFVVPLFWGFKDSMQKNRIFALSVFFAFMFMAYYFLVNEDYIQKRFLSIPALLLYPWIGAGMHRFFEYLSGRFSKKVFAAIFILFFILPVYQCFEMEWKEDKSLMMAAKWIEREANPEKLKIITMDKRFLYYADREFWVGNDSSTGGGDVVLHESEIANIYNLEQIAQNRKLDLILLKISSKKEAPDFRYFKRIKEFKDRKNVSYVFSSPETAAIISGSNS